MLSVGLPPKPNVLSNIPDGFPRTNGSWVGHVPVPVPLHETTTLSQRRVKESVEKKKKDGE